MSSPHSDAPDLGAPLFIGLDLSLSSTGVARITNGRATVSRVKSRPTVNDSSRERVRRLASIVAFLRAEVPIGAHVAVEGPAYGRSQGQHILGGLWWMVRDMLSARQCDVIVVQPSGVKKYATGKGNAQKDEVLAAVVRRYTEVDVRGNDEADALVLAAMCARHHGRPLEASLPKTHLEAMKGIGR